MTEHISDQWYRMLHTVMDRDRPFAERFAALRWIYQQIGHPCPPGDELETIADIYRADTLNDEGSSPNHHT